MKQHKLTSKNAPDWIKEIISISKIEKSIILNTSSYEPNREEYLMLLKSLDNQYLSYKEWNKQIWIKNGIDTKTILDKEALIIKAAKKFRETAHILMDKLGTKYNVDFESGKGLKELRILNDHENRINEIDNEWKFNFHGYECLIWNTLTGQSLDMIFITRPEFGVLDPYFFLQYVSTTPEWTELKELFKDEYNNADQALLTLEAHGYIDRFLDDDFSSRGLIVR